MGGTEYEGKELVVVETPDSVRSGGLEVVGCLEVAHDGEVFGKEFEDEGWVVVDVDEFDLSEAEAVMVLVLRLCQPNLEATHIQHKKFSSCPDP